MSDFLNLYKVEGDIVYNIYELVTGGDIMEDIVKRQFYSERDASIAIEQILKGVEFIHSKGFLHRDLKPHNLLLQSKRSKIIKVTDFGLCVARRPQPNYDPFQHGETGTPAYKSPEVYSNGLYDTDCDVWRYDLSLVL
jgi:serine/threonine protein kinase